MAVLQANSSPLSVGGGNLIIEQGVLVPDISISGSSIVEKPVNGRISTYVVKEGDTISQIAEMFNVSVNTVKWANDIGNVIKEGQVLVILPISGIKHTVEKGDTLASLAKKYNGDIDDIAKYNGLDKDVKLSVGESIVIPGGQMSGTKPSGTSVASSSSGPSSGSNQSGYFIRPINGGVKSQGIHGYNAVDLAAPIGTPIMASASGEVIVSRSSGWNGGYGNYIVISHANGTQTLYAHNSRNAVSVGDYVKQGEVIGYIGSTGQSTGPHVHFEVRGGKNPF